MKIFCVSIVWVKDLGEGKFDIYNSLTNGIQCPTKEEAFGIAFNLNHKERLGYYVNSHTEIELDYKII